MAPDGAGAAFPGGRAADGARRRVGGGPGRDPAGRDPSPSLPASLSPCAAGPPGRPFLRTGRGWSRGIVPRPPCAGEEPPAALPVSAACERGPGADGRGGSSGAAAARHGLGSLCPGDWGLPRGKSSVSRAGIGFRYLGSVPGPLSKGVLWLPQNHRIGQVGREPSLLKAQGNWRF